MLDLSIKYEGVCYPMLGLHPCYINDNYETEINEIFKFFSSNIIAIGEIGLDFYRNRDNEKKQIKAIEIQCEYALKKNLPIVIENKYQATQGYSGNFFDIDSSLRGGILYQALDPSIFEVKFPNTDIKGKVLGDNLGVRE